MNYITNFINNNIFAVRGNGRRCSYKNDKNELVKGDPAYDELVSDPNYKHCMSVSSPSKLKSRTYRIIKDVCNSLSVGRAFIPPVIGPGESKY